MRAWLAAILLLVAATCPQIEVEQFLVEGTQEVITQVEAVDYQLVIDRSGSMRGAKLDQAKQAARELVDSLHSKDRAAIITFDSKADLVQTLTADKEVLNKAINSIEAGDFTRYGQAINLATQQFANQRNVIIFLSDGRPDEQQQQINEAVQQALGRQGCIFTVAYAQEDDDAGREILANIARQSQELSGCGAYFSAEENSFELSYIFRTIYSDVSAQNVFDVNVDVKQEETVTLETALTSSYNQRIIDVNTCFQPEINVLITKDKEVVYDESGSQSVVEVDLQPGTYNYFVTATETCEGACLFTGSTTGSFRVDQETNACYTPWDQISTILTANDAVTVYITEDGFQPQSISTEGVITWENLDTRPHKISSLQGAFTSPTIQPGESWTYAVPPGDYSYVDVLGGFNGLLSQEEDVHRAADVIFMLDASGSMAGEPLIQAQEAIDGIAEAMSPSDRIGLISFNDRSRSVQLTGDTRRVLSATNSLIASGPTSYVAAIDELERIRPTGSSRGLVAIFLSDGVPYDRVSNEEITTQAARAIGSGCLYTIGYGNPDAEAAQLLTDMAFASKVKNNCGAYYFSTAKKEELSSVFGEIYASTQNIGLEIFDTTVDIEDEEVTISTRIRSAGNGQLVPTTTNAGCIPEAQVNVLIAGRSYPLNYDGGVYTADITLETGVYRAFLNAKLQNPDSFEQAAVGSKNLEIEIENNNEFYGWPILIGIGLIVYIFMRKQVTDASEK